MTYNFTGTLDGLALLDETVRTEKHDTDLASLEVHAHALDARGEPAWWLVKSPPSGVDKSGTTYSTSSSAWALARPCTRAIPSL
jgi:hypothetical protein